jgi:hypothetical protein
MKPKLPSVLEVMLPEDVVNYIYKFVPHHKKVKKEHSPSLQRELMRIQTVTLGGKSASYMKGLSAFCLD